MSPREGGRSYQLKQSGFGVYLTVIGPDGRYAARNLSYTDDLMTAETSGVHYIVTSYVDVGLLEVYDFTVIELQ